MFPFPSPYLPPIIYIYGNAFIAANRLRTCTVTSGSTSITMTAGNTSDFGVGSLVTGTGIPGGATVVSKTSTTVFVISAAATSSGSFTLTFNDPFRNIIGNTTKENLFLAYCQSYSMKGLNLYDVLTGSATASDAEVLATSDKTNLQNFIKKARQTYGITEVSVVGNFFRINATRYDGTIGYRRAIEYNATVTDPLQVIDYIDVENEFWNWNINELDQIGTGTLGISSANRTVTLTGAAIFGTGQAVVRNWIYVNGEVRQIANVVNSTTIEVDRPFNSTGTGFSWMYGFQKDSAGGFYDPCDFLTWKYRAKSLKALLNANPSANIKSQCYLGHPAGSIPAGSNSQIQELAPYFDRICPHDYITASAGNGGAPNYGYTQARLIAACANLSGTISASGITITGTSTLFNSQLFPKCRIEANGEHRTVTGITSDTSLTVDAPFSSGLPAGTSYGLYIDFMPIVSFERPEEGNNFTGRFMQGMNSAGVATFSPPCIETAFKYYVVTGFNGGTGYPTQVAPAYNAETNVLVQRRSNLVGFEIFDQSIMRNLSPQPSFCAPATCTTPTGLSASSLTTTSATVSWTAVGGAVGYVIQYRPVGSPTWTSVNSVATSKVITGLTPSTVYEFQLQCDCGSGILSTFSGSTNFTTLTPACVTPSGLNVTLIGLTQAQLNWNLVSGAVGYNVQYRVVGAGSWTSTTSSVTNKTITGLTPNTQYEFEVQTDCGTGTSSFSSIISFFTLACATPTGLGTSGLLGNSATLAWNPVATATSYLVEWRPTGGGSWTSVSAFSASYILSGLTAGTQYEFRVTSDCGGGITSGVSSIANFTTIGCTTPTSLVATTVYQTSVDIAWVMPSGFWIYNYRYRVVGSSTWITAGMTAATMMSLSGLTNNTTYEFQLQTDCGTGLSSYSSLLTFTTLACSDVTGLNVTSIGLFDSVLNWSAASGATSYNVRYRIYGSPTWTTTSTSALTLSITGLSYNTQYEFQVQADCGSGITGAFSASTTWFTLSCDIPTGLFTSTITSSSAIFNWTAVANATIYNIRYRRVSTLLWNYDTSVTNSYTVTGLPANALYEYQIQSDCGGGLSSWSVSDTFTTDNNPPTCLPPTVSFQTINVNDVVAVWNSQGLTGELRYREQGTFTWTTISVTSGGTQPITGLLENTSYEVEVQLQCQDLSWSGWSTTALVTTASTLVMVLSVNIKQVSCAGGCDAEIQVFVSGGLAPYTYDWGDGTTTYNHENLCAGTYTCTVTDSNGLVESITTILPDMTPITFTTTTTDTLCAGGSNGSITVDSVTGGGSIIYEFSLDGITWQQSNVFYNLPAGTYDVYVKNSLGCVTASQPATVNDTLTGVPTFTYTATPISCHNGSDGTLTIIASGGGAPGTYEYTIDNGATWQSSNVFTGLTYGFTYILSVKDAVSCMSLTQSVVFPNPASVVIDPNVDSTGNFTCGTSDNGIITINVVTGGQSPYEYSNDNGVTWQSSNIFTGLATGLYHLKAKDANGCVSAALDISIFDDNNGVLVTTQDNSGGVSCSPNPTTTVEVTATVFNTGSSAYHPPFTYLWQDGQTTPAANFIFTTGTTLSYTVVVTDAIGCTATVSGSVQSAAQVTIPASMQFVGEFSPCDPNSTIQAQAIGFNDFAFVLWNTFEFTEFITIYQAQIGTSVYFDAYDGSGQCPVHVELIVPSVFANPIVVAVTTTDPTCAGCSDGTATATPSFGVAPYTYLWSDGQTGQIATGLAAGTYTVTVTDSGGCTAQQTITINTPNGQLLAIIISTPATCIGSSDGTATIQNILGGIAPYTITWNDPAGTVGYGIIGVAAGVYIAHIVDANGLTGDFPVTVAENQVDCNPTNPPYDFAGDTIAFSKLKNRWVTRYSFVPEYYGSIRNEIVSFKDGQLWLHNVSNVYNNFYGTQYSSTISFPSNKAPLKVKIFKAIAENANSVWSVPEMKIPPNNQIPSGMQTSLPTSKFVNKEGKYYSDILRDVNTPYALSSTEALINGRPMRGQAMSVKMENTDTTLAVLLAVEITYIYSEKS